jgi:hypothetical protein
MNNTTGLDPSSVLILSTTSIFQLPLQCAPLGQYGKQLPLLGGAHRLPAADLIPAAQAANTKPLRIEFTDIDTRGRRTLLGPGWALVQTAVTVCCAARHTALSASAITRTCVELWGCLAYSSNATGFPYSSRNKNLEI